MFADVIVDISHKNVDRPFCYRVPDAILPDIHIGSKVEMPFGQGDRVRTGYVIGLNENPTDEIEESRIKDLRGVVKGSVSAEENLIALAAFIKEQYGSTMIHALQTVLPVKREIKTREERMIHAGVPELTLQQGALEALKKKQKAKARLLEELVTSSRINYSLVTGKLNVPAQTVKSLEKAGFLTIEVVKTEELPFTFRREDTRPNALSDEQQHILDTVKRDRENGEIKNYYIYGITGSGKTEVYMGLIEECLKEGKQAILLIPEISLTYQNLQRFYHRFGNKVSVVHSKLTDGEKYRQIKRAMDGEISIMIGPRSALFTPFRNLGLIIIDEEHEPSYKSESMPKYHAREVAIKLGELTGANVVMGSATPSVDAFYRIQNGELPMFRLSRRLTGGELAKVHVVDMKEELANGNKSVFSEILKSMITKRLEDGEQTMLFLNRRGYAGSVVCRECGEVIKCPHCDISLSQHMGGKLVCHYCGYETESVKKCPKCGSVRIAGFRAGTEQIEEQIHKTFPQAVVLRMDADTTKKAEDYESILSKFASGEADILLGTQMIVKGHDFRNVTLMGVLLADMSLNGSDYRSAERTFQLLTQAVGRAGRGELASDAVIQTYQPEHYAVTFAAAQDYEGFYEEEIAYREFLDYPPAGHMLSVQFFGPDWKRLSQLSLGICREIEPMLVEKASVSQIGPGKAALGKKKDIYRQVVYYKCKDIGRLIAVKDYIEKRIGSLSLNGEQIQFDMDPMNSF